MTSKPSRLAAPSWFIDELAHAGRENVDERHVARYDAKMNAAADQEVRLLQEVGLTGDSRVVEFGSGTGQLTVRVAPVCGQVIAVDVSPVMLRRLQLKVNELRLDNVTLIEAGFLSFPHLGPPVDFVYSRLALHHLPDFWKVVALDRVRQLLAPGGMLRLWDLVYDFEPAETLARIEAWCASAGAEADVDTNWTRDELEEHVRDEHSTFSWLLEAMIRRTGFEILRAERSADGIDAKYLLRAA